MTMVRSNYPDVYDRQLPNLGGKRMKKMRGQPKVEKVMHEYKHGTLKSSSGQKVQSRDQAIAIAMSEAGLSRKGKTRMGYSQGSGGMGLGDRKTRRSGDTHCAVCGNKHPHGGEHRGQYRGER